jgi:hypothetical protein
VSAVSTPCCLQPVDTDPRRGRRNRHTSRRSGADDVTGSGYRPEGELVVEGLPLDDPVLLDETRAVLTAGSLANDAVLRLRWVGANSGRCSRSSRSTRTACLRGSG